MPPSLTAVGTVDLQIAELMSPDIESSGQLRLNVEFNGYGSKPEHARSDRDRECELCGGDRRSVCRTETACSSSDRIQIGGWPAMSVAALSDRAGRYNLPAFGQFNVRTNATGIRMLYPDNVREKVDANLTMSGSTEAGLSGQVRLTELSFTPDFDLADLIGESPVLRRRHRQVWLRTSVSMLGCSPPMI
jgi:hypothetical protein